MPADEQHPTMCWVHFALRQVHSAGLRVELGVPAHQAAFAIEKQARAGQGSYRALDVGMVRLSRLDVESITRQVSREPAPLRVVAST